MTNASDLDRLVERFWGSSGPDNPVVVTTAALPEGYRLVEEYAVVPSRSRPRFLVPLGVPRAVTSAFTSHLSTVSPGSRLAGHAISSAFRSGAAGRAFRDRLRVGIDARVPVRRRREHLLMREFAAVLDVPHLVGVHPVRRATPNAKPTVRLFDAQGSAVGYAKVGWSPPTRTLVRNEAEVLAALSGRAGGLTVPRPLAQGLWGQAPGDKDYLITSPLPPGLGPWRTPPSASGSILRQIASTGRSRSAPLAGSPYARGVHARLRAAERAQPDEAQALLRWLALLESTQQPLEFGRWHGDWVPWNLATTREGGAVWDWEYSAPEAPVGFDLLHWHFQSSLASPTATLDSAAVDMREHLHELEVVGVPAAAHRLVAHLYLLEMLTRAVGLAAEGSGWNPKLHPRLVTFAQESAGA